MRFVTILSFSLVCFASFLRPWMFNIYYVVLSTFIKVVLDVPLTVVSCTNSSPRIPIILFSALTISQKINASATASKNVMAQTHNAGAAALIMHRGQANVVSPIAIGLLFAVRSQLVCFQLPLGYADVNLTYNRSSMLSRRQHPSKDVRMVSARYSNPSHRTRQPA